MKRRSFIAVTATIAIAGCTGSDDGEDDPSSSGADGKLVDETLEQPEDEQNWFDAFSDSFSASEGDEIDVTIDSTEADTIPDYAGGGEGVVVVLMPEEDEVSIGDDDTALDETYWELDDGEELHETIEISEDDDYLFWLQFGASAHVTAEFA